MVQLSLLVLVALVCSEIMLQCSSNAAPVLGPLESEAGGAGHEGLTESFNPEEEGERGVRMIRSVQGPGRIHDYSITSFKQYIKEWRPSNCSSNFNCGTVSKHWCNSTALKKMYCLQGNYIHAPNLCRVSFQIAVDQLNAMVVGTDLSLFKQTEDPHFTATYYVYVIYQRGPYLQDIAGARLISSSCNGWQTFHIDEVKNILDFSNTYENNITLSIVILKETSVKDPVTLLSCDEISSLFVLDKNAVLREHTSSIPESEGPTPAKKESEPTTAKKEMDEGSTLYSGEEAEIDEESKTSQEHSQTVSIAEDKQEDTFQEAEVLVPIVTAFVAGDALPRGLRFRRERTTPTCELRDKNVDSRLSIHPLIVSPASVNVHECVMLHPVNTSSGMQCVPSTHTSVTVMMELPQQPHTNNTTTTVYKTLPNTIITGCKLIEETRKESKQSSPTLKPSVPADNGPCKLQDKNVKLDEYINPSIVVPTFANVHECVKSLSLNNNASFQCVPSTYRRLDVLIVSNGRLVKKSLPKTLTTSCKLVEADDETFGDGGTEEQEGETSTRDKNMKEGKKEVENQGEEPTLTATEGQASNIITCELHDNVVNVTEYLNDSSILEPQMFNIYRCSPSAVAIGPEGQCQQCVPSSYGHLDVLKQIHSLNQNVTFLTSIRNVIATACTLNSC